MLNATVQIGRGALWELANGSLAAGIGVYINSAVDGPALGIPEHLDLQIVSPPVASLDAKTKRESTGGGRGFAAVEIEERPPYCATPNGGRPNSAELSHGVLERR